jgi:chromosome segregation ATPase
MSNQYNSLPSQKRLESFQSQYPDFLEWLGNAQHESMFYQNELRKLKVLLADENRKYSSLFYDCKKQVEVIRALKKDVVFYKSRYQDRINAVHIAVLEIKRRQKVIEEQSNTINNLERKLEICLNLYHNQAKQLKLQELQLNSRAKQLEEKNATIVRLEKNEQIYRLIIIFVLIYWYFFF